MARVQAGGFPGVLPSDVGRRTGKTHRLLCPLIDSQARQYAFDSVAIILVLAQDIGGWCANLISLSNAVRTQKLSHSTETVCEIIECAHYQGFVFACHPERLRSHLRLVFATATKIIQATKLVRLFFETARIGRGLVTLVEKDIAKRQTRLRGGTKKTRTDACVLQEVLVDKRKALSVPRPSLCNS